MWATVPADWANIVRDRRLALGLSQDDLADEAGTTRQWVVRFEKGLSLGARLDTVLNVLDALGLAADITTEGD